MRKNSQDTIGKTTPVLSVLMPVYNASVYLRDAIGSVLNQSFTDFELVAVNDGSSDSSLAILRRFEERDERIRIISRPNTGIVGALNDGLWASRGKYVARMDADDICLPERFQHQIDYLEYNDDVVVVGGRIRTIDSDGDPISNRNVITDHDTIEERLLSGRTSVLVHPTIMVRRSVLEAIGGYRDFDTSEDLDLYLRLTECGKAANINDILLLYRMGRFSLSASKDSERVSKNKTLIVNEARRRRGLPALAEPVRVTGRDGDIGNYHVKVCLRASASGFVKTAVKHLRLLVRVRGVSVNVAFLLARSIRLILKSNINTIASSLVRRTNRRPNA